MSESPVKENKKNSTKTIILAALLTMIVLIVAWHFIIPIIGVSFMASAALVEIAIAIIVLLCITTLLFFVFTGIGIIILSTIVFMMALAASLLFPLLFPIIIPVLLVMLVIGKIVRRNKS